MTKNEYMSKLAEALRDFDAEIREEIISDYEEHFAIGQAEGKGDEEIIAELGSIEELVNELKTFTGDKKAEGKGTADKFDFSFDTKELEKGLDDVIKGFAGFLGSVAATFTKGAGKFSGEAETVVKDFAQNVGTAAEKVAGKSTEFAEVVVEKSTAFAKEVADNYKAAKGTETHTTEAPDNEPDNVSEKYPCTEECKKVIVETDCGDIIVKKSDDNDFNFAYVNNGTANQQLAYKFDWAQNGDTIKVVCKKRPGATSFFQSLSCPDIKVTVCVPEGLEKIDVITASGDVTVEGIDTESVKINAVSGDALITGVKNGFIAATTVSGDANVIGICTTAVNIKSVSGDITVEGTVGSINLGTTSGDIDVKAVEVKDITTNSVSGDAEIELEGIGGYRANLKSVSGELAISYGDETCKYIKSGTYTLGDGSCNVTAGSVSGCVKIRG